MLHKAIGTVLWFFPLEKLGEGKGLGYPELWTCFWHCLHGGTLSKPTSGH